MFGPVDRTFAQTTLNEFDAEITSLLIKLLMTSETPSKLSLEPQSMHFEFNVAIQSPRLGKGFSGDKIFVPFARHRCTWKG
jgi:hypothetical protein